MTPSGSTDATQVKFAAERQKTDSAGKTSLFVVKLPSELQGKKVKVTVNNIQVGSERFRIEFSNENSQTRRSKRTGTATSSSTEIVSVGASRLSQTKR